MVLLMLELGVLTGLQGRLEGRSDVLLDLHFHGDLNRIDFNFFELRVLRATGSLLPFLKRLRVLTYEGCIAGAGIRDQFFLG